MRSKNTNDSFGQGRCAACPLAQVPDVEHELFPLFPLQNRVTQARTQLSPSTAQVNRGLGSTHVEESSSGGGIDANRGREKKVDLTLIGGACVRMLNRSATNTPRHNKLQVVD